MAKIIRNNRVYGGTPTNLGDIQNVNITSPTNNQALVYDSTTNKWKNDNVSAVGSLNDLTDVTISSVQNKQELVYNSTSSVFENKTTRIELTQAQYDALTTPEADIDYYITDAPSMNGTSADLSYDGTAKSVYTKIGEMDTTISSKANQSTTYTKTEVDNLLINIGTTQSLLLPTAISTTSTSYNTYSSRKFSDYNFLIFKMGASATDIRQTAVLPIVEWISGKAINMGALHGASVATVTSYSYSSINIQYYSDTAITAIASGSGVLNYLTIYGIKSK